MSFYESMEQLQPNPGKAFDVEFHTRARRAGDNCAGRKPCFALEPLAEKGHDPEFERDFYNACDKAEACGGLVLTESGVACPALNLEVTSGEIISGSLHLRPGYLAARDFIQRQEA